MSTGGTVCSASPLAASAGLRVLTEGGNAFDAALAVAAVETVTLPSMCGLGGEAVAILYQAATGKAYGLNSTGPAPQGATPAFYRSQGFTQVPRSGPLACSPPGELAAFQLINERFGTRPLAKLLEAAIEYAEDGFPISPRVGSIFADSAEGLAQSPSAAATFLKDGKPYGPGEVFVNRNLGRTLRRIAAAGAEEFYRGALAREITRAFQEASGLITEASLAAVVPELYPPLSTTYRAYSVAENRPPSQGTILLEMLNILEGYDLASLGYLSAESVHLMVEAKKLAFADRNRYLADPRVEQVPLEMLVSKEHAARRRELIDAERAAVRVEPAYLGATGTDTSYFCVADKEGSTVSFIHSLFDPWGSAFVAGDSGILFNNRQRGFRLEEGHPNTMSPGKRPMHTLNAYTVFHEGKPFLVGGTPGADFQVQGNLQMITGVIDYGMPLQQLVEAPRWTSMPGSDPSTLEEPHVVAVEPHMPEEVRQGLQERGHTVVDWPPGVNRGIVQLIQIDQATGVKRAASDPRGDGHAVAL